jgi:serine/threonine protein kinase
MRLRLNEFCPIHKSLSCCGRETLPKPGLVMGTVGYMSAEQVRGKTADHCSDIFAFGTILYEMVTGKQTFRKPTSAETMTAILNEDPPSISQVTAATPPGLQRVVHRCLEKNPEQRFQSASDMAFALEAGLAEMVKGRPVPSGSRCQRNGRHYQDSAERP